MTDRQTDGQASHAGLCEPGQGEGVLSREEDGARRTRELGGVKTVGVSRLRWAARGPSLIQPAAGTGQMGHDVLPRFPVAGPPQRRNPTSVPLQQGPWHH